MGQSNQVSRITYSWVFCCSAELFSQAVWTEVKDMEDPELQQLAGKLPQTVMHSRADSTVRKYLGAYKRWKRWALEYCLPVMPAKEHYVGLYLQHVANTVASKLAVEEACNSLAWLHCTAGFSPPTASPIVRAILNNLRRSLVKPTNKQKPYSTRVALYKIYGLLQHVCWPLLVF